MLTRGALGRSQHLSALLISGFVFGAVYVGANLARFVASGEEIPLDAFPGPLRRAIAVLIARVRRDRETTEAGERAA
jgi:hypothetical protein